MTATLSIPLPAKRETRYYRPELDAIRFLAFLLVLFHHGPVGGFPFSVLRDAGGFGLSMFFLLSAYLITELLIREREKTGTVDWPRFFTRRALRIWPLYFGAIGLATLLHGITRLGLVSMPLFVANWVASAATLGVLVGHLWSISVEEQFYLLWPPLVKWGGKRSLQLASVLLILLAGVWLILFDAKGWRLWYDTPVEFLFFAAGALLAMATRRGVRMPPAARAALFLTGTCGLALASRLGRIGMDDVADVRPVVGYSLALAGCVLIFLAVLGIQTVPRVLVYLGRISYGLYVFHVGAIVLAKKAVPLIHPAMLYACAVDGVALLLTVGIAHLSYQYFEKPFLRWKERFTVIPSRELQ